MSWTKAPALSSLSSELNLDNNVLMDAVRFHCHFRCPSLILELLNRKDITYETLTFKEERRKIFRGRVCESALDIVRTY